MFPSFEQRLQPLGLLGHLAAAVARSRRRLPRPSRVASEAVDKHDTADCQQPSCGACERAACLLQVELLIILLAGGQPCEAVPMHGCHGCCGSGSASRLGHYGAAQRRGVDSRQSSMLQQRMHRGGGIAKVMSPAAAHGGCVRIYLSLTHGGCAAAR
jgi:hypothetical protein